MTFLIVTGRTSRKLNLLFEARIREKSLSLFKLANLVESASALVTLVFCDESSVSILFSFCLFWVSSVWSYILFLSLTIDWWI